MCITYSTCNLPINQLQLHLQNVFEFHINYSYNYVIVIDHSITIIIVINPNLVYAK